jgi:phosphate-selective porin OprO/OprP
MLFSTPRFDRFLVFLVAIAAFAGMGSFARAQETEPPSAAATEEAGPITEDVLQDITDDAGPSAFEAVLPRHSLNPFEYSLRWQDGIRLERNDGLFRLKVGARLEGDVAGYYGDDEIEEEFDDNGTYGGIRRAWLTLGGTVGSRWLYKVQVDLSGQSADDDGRTSYVREIYVAAAGLGPFGTVKAGSVREPFTLNGLTSSHTLSFMERALPQVFSPAYNPGIVSENHAFDGRMAWAYGVFYYANSGGDNSAQIDLTARLTGLPIYDEEGERLLHVGASYSHQFRDGFDLRYTRRPETHFSSNYVDTGSVESNNIDLFGIEILAIRGPLSARSEFMLSHVDRPHGNNETFWAAYAEVAYILTGESRPYRENRGVLGRLVPSNPVAFRDGGLGLWEVAARYSYVDLNNRDTRGGRLGDWSIALNWYARAHVRVMTEYVHAKRYGVGRSNIIQSRLALDF